MTTEIRETNPPPPRTAPRRTRRLKVDLEQQREERRRELIRKAAKLSILLHYDALVELGRR